jgi:hypothetical protein
MSNEPYKGGQGDPGKGSLTIPPNDGDLIRGGYTDGVIRGDTKGFGSGTSVPAVGAPMTTEGRSTDQDATNSLGGFSGEADSDPMFDKFKYEEKDMSDIDANQAEGSESPTPVASTKMSGTDSNPQEQELPDEQKL